MDLVLIDRLQILNYDEELRKEIKMKPMSRHYFLVPGNSGEQFHVFTSMAAWLLRKVGQQVEQPQEDDDPNFTISNILDNMRTLDIPVDFSPNKLKQGYGEYVIYVLERLTDKALKATNFVYKPIEIIQDEQNVEESIDTVQEDDQDIEEEDLEEFVIDEEVYSDDSEDGAYMGGIKHNLNEDNDQNKMISAYDEGLWMEEVEKVAPALRVRVAPSARDWRAHLQQLITYRQELDGKAETVRTGLGRIAASATRVLEATRAREQLLAARIPTKLANLRSEYDRTLTTYKSVSGGVTQRQEILNDLSEKVEIVKQKTELKGSTMNDTSPIVNMKKALVNLKKEIQQMDLQLAVLMWTVIDKQSRAKKMMPVEHMT